MCKTTRRTDAFVVGYMATIFSGIGIGWNAVELANKHETLLILEIAAWIMTIVGAFFLYVGVIKEIRLPIIIWIVVALVCGIFLLLVRGLHLSRKWRNADTLYIAFKIIENAILIVLTIMYILCPYLYIVKLNEERG